MASMNSEGARMDYFAIESFSVAWNQFNESLCACNLNVKIKHSYCIFFGNFGIFLSRKLNQF